MHIHPYILRAHMSEIHICMDDNAFLTDSILCGVFSSHSLTHSLSMANSIALLYALV